MAELGTFDKLLAEVGQALLPLRQALTSPAAFAGLLQKLGWTADDIPAPVKDVGTSLDTLYDALRRLLGDGGINLGNGVGHDSDDGPSGEALVDEAGRVLTAVQGVISTIQAISTAPAAAIPASLRADGFPAVFPGQLIDYLVITYLRRFHPSIGFALRALGVIKVSYAPATGNRPPHQQLSLDLADLPALLDDPAQVLQAAFGWGEPDFDARAFASQVDNLLSTFGAAVTTVELETATASAVQGPPTDPHAPPTRAIRAVLLEQAVPAATADVRLIGLPASGNGGSGGLPGVALLPSFDGSVGRRLELRPDLAVTIRSDLDLRGGVALVARPGQGLSTILGFESDQAPVHDAGSIEVLVERPDLPVEQQPVLLLGSLDGTRLQFRSIAGTGGVRLVGDEVDVFAEIDVRGLEFVLRPDDADGFIAAILPADGISLRADLAVGLSHRSGFYFRGTSQLEIQLPARQQLGPLEILGLTLSVRPGGATVPIDLGASVSASLGPVTAVVQNIGLTARLTGRGEHDGNLGPLDLSIGFKPPTGVGISIDAGVISGGGFLAFDPARGEYGGAVELEFADFLQLKGFGLITTRTPDSAAGFSLLVVLTAEFGEGIQLGYGFTLLAVGGLLGLNRGMNLQALAEGVRTGAIESVMFPADVVANAPRILSDLNAFFPAEQGTFLVGPMAKIGWGTPTLVSISLGVIIEIPGNIAILGVLRAALPSPQEPLLLVQIDFVGVLELDKSRLWFVAQLFGSRILTMTLDGGAGLLVGWGDNPDLVLTVGGFHPAYRAPSLPFAVPPRLTMNILNEPGLLIRVSGYFAITSNTVQFGGTAELKLKFGSFGVEGHLGFDALFQFSPFRFAVAVSAHVSLRAFGVGLFGIDLKFQLEGPAPWRAHGRGSIGFLFFSISANFDITWGEDRSTTLPPIAVLPLLAAEIGKTEGWATRLPTGGGQALVNLRQLDETDRLVLHPLGSLFVRQRAVPLGVRVDRIGAQPAADAARFSVALVPDSDLERASGLQPVSVIDDKFAMAQFQNFSDAAKLSRPGYETQDAGIELTAGAGPLSSARVVRRSARYELHIIDSGTAGAPAAVARARVASGDRVVSGAPLASGAQRSLGSITSGAPKRFSNIHPGLFEELLVGSSTSRSAVSRREATLRQPFASDDTLRIGDQRWVVAYLRSNLQAFPPATFRNQTTAADAMAGFLAADSSLIGHLHVIPVSEAAASPAVPGTWSAAGELPVPASEVDAVLLAKGTVLVAGGTAADGTALAATALFDPTANSWKPGPELANARRGHTISRLTDGRVVVAGGRTGDTVLASTEVYDPASGTWSTAPGALTTARYGHSATALGDGSLLVAGGSGRRRPDQPVGAAGASDGDGALASAELLGPVSRTWSPIEPMTDARTGHQAVLLHDGRVLVIGGALPTGDGAAAMAYCELYTPSKGWSPTGSLTVPRQGHQATLLPDHTVLVTGGTAVVASDGSFSPHSLDSAELYDPQSGLWTPTTPLPGGGRSGHRALLTSSGTVLVIGGTDGPEFTAGFRNVIVYHPGGRTWTAAGALGLGRSAFAVTELGDRRVLIAGGLAAAGAATAGPGDRQPAGAAEVLIP